MTSQLRTTATRHLSLVRAATLATVLVAATTSTGPAVFQGAAHATGAAATGAAATGTVPTDFREFTTWIADDVNTYWESVYGAGGAFSRPALVFFVDPIASPCDDYSTAEEGPYYCDDVIYIPDGWFAADPLRLNDAAVAYVIAHEIAHDVQDTQGILTSRNTGIITSVQTELQADCLAGVWLADAAARGMLEPGDLDEVYALAAAIGDDALGASPEEYSHGSSQQRIDWLNYGFQVGDGASCVTY